MYASAIIQRTSIRLIPLSLLILAFKLARLESKSIEAFSGDEGLEIAPFLP